MKYKEILFIEPEASAKEAPIDDYLVSGMEHLIKNAKRGIIRWNPDKKEYYFCEGGAYRGWHTTKCGEKSDNANFLIADNIVTNSLAPFYLKYYRTSIPEDELQIIKQLLGTSESVIKFKDFFTK